MPSLTSDVVNVTSADNALPLTVRVCGTFVATVVVRAATTDSSDASCAAISPKVSSAAGAVPITC